MKIVLPFIGSESISVLNYIKPLATVLCSANVYDWIQNKTWDNCTDTDAKGYSIEVENEEQLTALRTIIDFIRVSSLLDVCHIARIWMDRIPEKFKPEWQCKVEEYWVQKIPHEVTSYDGIGYEDLNCIFYNWYKNIGEAMGPVCYVGFCLIDELKKHQLPYDWVIDCIKYYEKELNNG